jgi:hypothetical protein
MANRRPEEPVGETPLNPGLHRSIDETHGKQFEGTDPMKTVSVKDVDEGRSWPLIWAIVAAVCVLITIYLLA